MRLSYSTTLLILVLSMPYLPGQARETPTAWEALLQKDPLAVDDPGIGWQERLILHALTPAQARSYYQGADADSLVLNSGQTLSEYLKSRISPPGNVYVPLPSPCSLFGNESSMQVVDRREFRSFQARGDDLSWQGGSATGCGIPLEAVAIALQLKARSPAGITPRIKLWPTDAPEPLETVWANPPGPADGYETMALVALCRETCEQGEFHLRASDTAQIEAQATGYFRPLKGTDQPGGGVKFAGSVDNTWYGAGTPLGVNTGTNNSAYGYKSLRDNLGGSLNTAVGAWSMTENTEGGANTAVGQSALEHNLEGSRNTAVGVGALHTNTTVETYPGSGNWRSGEDNTAVGYRALHLNQRGSSNTVVGRDAGYNTLYGYNSFFGREAGYNSTTGGNNSYFGYNAGKGPASGSEGEYNSFFGSNAGDDITDGDENAFFGYWAGNAITTGFGNSAFGGSAGSYVSTGDYNTFLGYEANVPPGSATYEATAIGYKAYVSQSNSVVLGSIAGFNNVSTSAKVGIGTPAPATALHVRREDGTAQILVEEAAGSTAVRTQFQLRNNGAPRFALENTTSGIEWSFQQSGPGNFLISKNATGGPEMQVYQNGQVRMGPGGTNNFTLSPTGNLTIKGSLTANGSTFPDYVFEPNYDLMPLSDLRTFIEQEKRLPDIPSAEEVKKQGGHNMTELQLKLLEKIEELTLYTLEQEKKLQEMETLKVRLAAIEAILSDR